MPVPTIDYRRQRKAGELLAKQEKAKDAGDIVNL